MKVKEVTKEGRNTCMHLFSALVYSFWVTGELMFIQEPPWIGCCQKLGAFAPMGIQFSSYLTYMSSVS